MTRELEVAQLLRADALFMSIVTGGVYTVEEIGVEGFRRGEDSSTNAAFDDKGYLKPTVAVRQSGLMPTGDLSDLAERATSVSQVVEIYFYEHRGHSEIEAAKQRSYEVLQGVRLSDSYPIYWEFETAPIPDMGPVKNSTVLRQDWYIVSIRKPLN